MFSQLMALPAADKCDCYDESSSLWTLETIFKCQRTSDFLIAVAYFSIPIELLCFVSCSNVPFKWVLFQFIAFIVLCGLTHLINGLAYGPHSFELMAALTVSKMLTALASSTTAITLMTLIPLLLKVKVRELMLQKKAQELRHEVGIIMRRREAGLHVRMLTSEIRRSVDRHTILYTTLIELSRALGLWNCAVWMPDKEEEKKKNTMTLTHELWNRNDRTETKSRVSIPMNDPDVVETVGGSHGVKILDPDRRLAVLSSGGLSGEEEGRGLGPVAAIRMPMLQASNFKGGTPDPVPACYAILVLVLPGEQQRQKPRTWTASEIEMVKVVADQVAVALSHASVLEESQLIRKRLEEQNLALQGARRSAEMASRARCSFQKVMTEAMKRPMHTVLGLLSILQVERGLTDDQMVIVDSMARAGNDLLSILMDDRRPLPLEMSMKPFHLHAALREVACLVKCLCNSRGFEFLIKVDSSLPNHVMGDDRRVVQVILHTVKILLGGSDLGGIVELNVFSVDGSRGISDPQGTQTRWTPSSSRTRVDVKFEFEIKNDKPTRAASSGSESQRGEGVEKGLSFSVCKRIVQMMQGDFWIVPSSSAGLIVRFQCRPSNPSDDLIHHEKLDSIFTGTTVLVADSSDTNRAVTRKLLEKLGCTVSTVRSGFECLTAISSTGQSSFRVILLELQLPGLNGFEVAARIRKFWSQGRPLILALTASNEEGLMERCMEIGMNGFIRKPATLQGMAKELRRVMLPANV